MSGWWLQICSSNLFLQKMWCTPFWCKSLEFFSLRNCRNLLVELKIRKLAKLSAMKILVVGRPRFKIKNPLCRTKNRRFISEIDFCVLFARWCAWCKNDENIEFLFGLQIASKAQSLLGNAFFVSTFQGTWKKWKRVLGYWHMGEVHISSSSGELQFQRIRDSIPNWFIKHLV